MALGIVLQQRWGRTPPVLAFTAWQLVLGGAVMLPVVVAVEGIPSTLTGEHAAGFAYQALVACGLAYTTWFFAISRLRAAAISLLGLLTPVVAASMGWLVRDEALAPLQLLGIAVVLAAVVGGQLLTPPPSRNTASATA